MWINTKTNNVYRFHWEIRSAFPNVSMPDSLTDSVLSAIGLEPIAATPKPAGYVAEEIQPTLVAGVWTQQWTVRVPTETETEAKAAEVRADRNRLLSQTDWTQVSDTPVDREAWATYRQSLRDITAQTGFPWEVVWFSTPDAVTTTINTM